MVNKLGTYITDGLARLHKTQGWLAERIGVSDNAVSKWKKTGRISRENFFTLVSILGTSGAPHLSEIEPANTEGNPESPPEYVDLPAGIRGERRVPLLTWSDLRDNKKMLNSTTHDGPTAVAPGDNVADNAFAVAYDSDAFLADIPRSATLVINPGTTWETGRLALMECSGAIVLRRLALDGERSMLIAHDAANWNATPLNSTTDRIIGLVACAYKNF